MEPPGTAPYSVIIEPDVTTLVARLSEGDQVFVLLDLAMELKKDPHRHGDVWMRMDTEVWRVLEIGERAQLMYVVDDDRRLVTLVTLTLEP